MISITCSSPFDLYLPGRARSPVQTLSSDIASDRQSQRQQRMVAHKSKPAVRYHAMAQGIPGERLQEIAGRLQAARAMVPTQMIALWRPSSQQNLHIEEKTLLPEVGSDETWVPTPEKSQFVRDAFDFLRKTLSSHFVWLRFEQFPGVPEHHTILEVMERLNILSRQRPSRDANAYRATSPFTQAIDSTHANVIPNILELAARISTAYDVGQQHEIRMCSSEEGRHTMSFLMYGNTCLVAWGHLGAAYVQFDVLLRRNSRGQYGNRASVDEYELLLITSPGP